MNAPFEGEGDPWMMPVPRATCGEGDIADTELQGAPGDRRCNLDIVQRLEVPTAGFTAWYDECAYLAGSDATTTIFVDEAGTPTVTSKLMQIGFGANWESLKSSEVSGLLAGYESLGSTLAFANLRPDCKQPTYLASVQVPGSVLGGSLGHTGNFNAAGTIFYATSLISGDVSAVDVMDPAKPWIITSDFQGIPSHDIFISQDGARAYMAAAVGNGVPGDPEGVGSVAIMDTTMIERREQNAKATLVHEVKWPDGNVTQYAFPVTWRGRHYLIADDELGSGSCGDPVNPIWGYARILDIEDENSPSLVSLIRNEAQHPDYCENDMQAPVDDVGFGVGTHYCNADRLYASGLAR